MKIAVEFPFSQGDGSPYTESHAFCDDIPAKYPGVSLVQDHVITGDFGEKVICPLALVRDGAVFPYTGPLTLTDEDGRFLFRGTAVFGVVVQRNAIPSTAVCIPAATEPLAQKMALPAIEAALLEFSESGVAYRDISYDRDGKLSGGFITEDTQEKFRVICGAYNVDPQTAVTILNKIVKDTHGSKKFFYENAKLGIILS